MEIVVRGKTSASKLHHKETQQEKQWEDDGDPDDESSRNLNQTEWISKPVKHRSIAGKADRSK